MIDIPIRYHDFIDCIRSENLITIDKANATISILDIKRGEDGNIQVQVDLYGDKMIITTPFKASFQALNSLVAGCMATINTDISILEAFASIKKLSDVKGRLECVAR